MTDFPIDSFEWAAGCAERFRLLHVDHATQVHTPKDSYHWYRDLIAHTRANGTPS